jgi:hypothetical protein
MAYFMETTQYMGDGILLCADVKVMPVVYRLSKKHAIPLRPGLGRRFFDEEKEMFLPPGFPRKG